MSKRGRKSWFEKLPPSVAQHFLLRRRAALAEAFSELILTPHPWDEQALLLLRRKIYQTISLFTQLKSEYGGKVSPAAVSADAASIGLEISYAGTLYTTSISDTQGKNFGSRSVFAGQVEMLEFGQLSTVDATLTWSYDKEKIDPAEALTFLEQELSCNVAMLCPPDMARVREEYLGKPPSGWPERTHDLRIRLTDFIRRFLAIHRLNLVAADPFTVFFLKPSRSIAEEHSVRSGLFGYEFVVDEGQKSHLDIHFQNAIDSGALQLAFPNGVCTEVFLQGRASQLHDIELAQGGYQDWKNRKLVEQFEAEILGGGVLIEVPVYSPGVGHGDSDGPDLIVTVRIQAISDAPDFAAAFPGWIGSTPAAPPPSASSGPPDADTDPAQIPDSKVGELLNRGNLPPLLPGESQILTEVCQKMVAIYLRASSPPAAISVIFPSAAMRKLQGEIRRIALSDSHVFIGGLSGVGKSTSAEAIHHYSRRRDQPYKRISAAQFSPELALSQLFGHVEGAFTGATKDKTGLLESLHGGTLFLDDIDALQPIVQARLLSYLDSEKFHKLGGEDKDECQSNVRLITATNRNILELINASNDEVASGRFHPMRADFFYRIKQLMFVVPPLSERPEDIRFFIDTFKLNLHDEAGLSQQPHIEDGFYEVAEEYAWPHGQIRQIQNAMLIAMVRSENGVLTGEMLSAIIAEMENFYCPPAQPSQCEQE